jgi:hypothetical protein
MPGILTHVISSVLFPAAVLSFTLLLHDFLHRRRMDWEKVCGAGILCGNFWEFWCTKGEGLDALPPEATQPGCRRGMMSS